MFRLFSFLLVVSSLVFAERGTEPVARRHRVPPAFSAFQGRLQAGADLVRYPTGQRFAWRGLTSFRLVESMARGRAAEVDRYLAWAAQHDVTVVRVLTMTKHIFALDPAEGRRALPAVLAAARTHGIYVEVVALADTGAYEVDLDQHVQAIGQIAAQHENAIVEIANEPDHPTQRKELADAQRLVALARLIPDIVPVALGSGSDWQHPLYAASTARPNMYLTAHFPRAEGESGWRPHLSLRSALRLQSAHKRFVVDDEPIGAGPVSKPGSRDADPEHWFGRGLLARVLKIGSTFHSDAGLHAKIPVGVELSCFEAWRRGMLYFPADLSEQAVPQDAGETTPDNAAIAPVGAFERGNAVNVFSLVDGSRGWIVAFGVKADPRVQLRANWKATPPEKHGGIWIQQIAR